MRNSLQVDPWDVAIKDKQGVILDFSMLGFNLGHLTKVKNCSIGIVYRLQSTDK